MLSLKKHMEQCRVRMEGSGIAQTVRRFEIPRDNETLLTPELLDRYHLYPPWP